MPLKSASGRPREQSGQMLVGVIVLLALMFFIGSAMALAVSSSLHSIAQTNVLDSTAYAAETAVAKGLARAASSHPTPFGPAPTIGHATAGSTTWSYTYEIVDAGGPTCGQSAAASDTAGSADLSASSESISIPPIASATDFRVYRVAAGGTPSSTGYIGTFVADPAGTTIKDTGYPIKVAPSATLASLGAIAVNGRALAASSCFVPVLSGSLINTWSVAAQDIPTGKCASQSGSAPQMPQFTDGDAGTVWGVIGWHSSDSTKPANLMVSTEDATGCQTSVVPCLTPVTGLEMLYFQCQLNPVNSGDKPYLNVVNLGGNAVVSAFLIREADSGAGDCAATTVGQAGGILDETDWRLHGCKWTNANPRFNPKQTLWDRVLP